MEPVEALRYMKSPLLNRVRPKAAPVAAPDAIRDGMWRGSRCFIIGGGPSLKGFDWSALAGERVIAINRAAEYCTPTIWFSIDTRFVRTYIKTGQLGNQALQRWENPDLPLLRVFCVFKGHEVDGPNVTHIDRFHDVSKLSPSISQGLGTGGVSRSGNSGFSALNLALCLGADPIYLLGFDMRDDTPKKEYFHSGYPNEHQKPDIYTMFQSAFEQEAQFARRRARIVNLCPDSGLRCFEFGRFEDLPQIQRPVVVSFHTPEYEAESCKLRASLIPLGIEHDIRPVQSRGSWETNCQHKTEFIRDALDRHTGRSVLWLDADAKVHRYPYRLDDLDCDFACHWRNKPGGDELLSGTMFWGNTAKARELLDLWQQANDHNPEAWDQRTLQKIVHGWEINGGRMLRLPASYCTIFDTMRANGEDPCIEHFQASRRLKGCVT
ncbi:hypothetical protein HQ520_16350 [bacterium]|nr:hypothetical protein [bacterium]